MKVFVISDIHGSYKFLNDFMKIYNEEKSDLLVILGDILYHGPRNPLPLDYNPQKVASLLNEIKDNILWIKGNCDGEVDEMVLDFPMVEKGVLFVNDHRVFLTHGHKYNEKNMTLNEGDILLYGHLHINFLKNENGVIVGNPGSLSLPKENTKNSYLVIENNKITIYSLDKEEIISVNF